MNDWIKPAALAMLDRLQNEVPMGSGHMRNLIEARAAFAELVTAAQAAIPAIETLREIARAKRGSASDIAVINLSAALARVNGGAA